MGINVRKLRKFHKNKMQKGVIELDNIFICKVLSQFYTKIYNISIEYPRATSVVKSNGLLL
jgi:hypothetical protein